MSSYSAAKQEALDLDVGIIESLIARNWQAHGKTKYHCRLSMAVKGLRKGKLLEVYSQTNFVKEETQRVKTKVESRKRKAAAFWELKTADPPQDELDLQQHVEKLKESIPVIVDVIERFEYASKALFQETVRGFFLPLMSVLLGCVARIRCLLQQLGLYALEVVPTLLESCATVLGNKKLRWDSKTAAKYRMAFLPTYAPRKDEEGPRTAEVLERLAIDSTIGGTQQVGGDSKKESSTIEEIIDHGEVIVGQLAVSNGNSDKTKPISHVGQADDHNTIDNNTEILLALQNNNDSNKTTSKKKKKKKRKSTEKQKDTQSGNSMKKRAKGDFFDDLFSK